MIKLKEIYKVGITTNVSDLPDIIQRQIYIGGPGFIVGRLESFSWGDYVVIDEDNRVHGMTKQDVNTIRSNAEVIKEKVDALTATEFANGMTDCLHNYVTTFARMPDGETVRKIVILGNNGNPKTVQVIDFEAVRLVFEKLKYHLGVDQYEQLTLTPYDYTRNCDPV